MMGTAVILIGFGFLTVYFTGVFPRFISPNEVSRIEAVYACVELGTFRFDRVLPVLGNHEDKAGSGGHFYSNKAPGLALAAIPVYRILRVLFPRPHSAADAVFIVLRILVVSTVCVFALARLRRRLAAQKAPAALLVITAAAFGTPYLFYARSFFSHGWTAALLFLSWDCVKKSEEGATRHRAGALLFGAGFLAGWAAISEYPVALLAAFLALRVIGGPSRRRLLLFALGASVPVSLLLLYNFVCFGSPWILSSAREAHPPFAELASRGLFGFGPPSLRVGLSYLLSPARGLLLFSPFWLWVLPGFFLWWKSRNDRADCVFALGTVVAFFILFTGHPSWYGGWCLGNRYLLPVLFFATLALPHALDSPVSRGLFATAVVSSIASYYLLTAAWPYLPPDLPWPPVTGSFWFLSRGWVAHNLLSPAGWASLLLPAFITLLAGAAALLAARPALPRISVAAALGLLPICILLLRPPEPSFGPRLWRAAIYGAYSGLDPARTELKRAGLTALPPSERRRAMQAWRLY